MISQVEVIQVMEQAVRIVLLTSLPMLGAALIIGVLVSIFQAVTQINEQTLAFVPKIIGILLSLVIFGGWIISELTDFTSELYMTINSMLR